MAQQDSSASSTQSPSSHLQAQADFCHYLANFSQRSRAQAGSHRLQAVTTLQLLLPAPRETKTRDTQSRGLLLGHSPSCQLPRVTALKQTEPAALPLSLPALSPGRAGPALEQPE